MRQLIALLLFFIFCVPTWGQNSRKFDNPYVLYERAEELYEKSQFAAARIEFENFINQGINRNDPKIIKARYYRGLSSLALYNDDAIALLEEFIRDYPETIYKNGIYNKIGEYFFQKEDFENALPWFQKVESGNLDSIDKECYFFKLGYSSFQLNNYDIAIDAFQEIRFSKGQYGAPSLYFFSHINYFRGSLQIAKEGFIMLKSDPSFSGIAPYYIVQINHRQGLYDSVITYAPTVLDSSNLSNSTDILHLLGDAHYRLGNYKEACGYLSLYNEKTKTTRDDDYQLGFSYLKTENFEFAIRYLDRVARVDDSLGQSAMYQIGNAYLGIGKLLPARNAFDKASKMKTLPIVAEDALYQFAVISFKIDINPYDESVRAFETYLNLYPNSSRKQDIYQYLVNVYANTSNYSKALESLDKLPSKDAQLKSVYQTVAYNYGVELFQNGQLEKALKAFSLVDTYNNEPQIMALAKYWRADVYYRKKEYENSISEYKKFLLTIASNSLDEKTDAYYNLGYAYKALEKTDESLENFGIYIHSNPKDKDKKIDAFFQLADGNYTKGKDELAIQYYKQILQLNTAQSDRAKYYLAKAYGYNKQANMKISALEELLKNHPDSKYIQNATYELAMSLKSQSQFDEAFKIFTQYIANYPKSPKVINCRIEMADVYYKQWNYVKAEALYREILSEFSNKQDVCAVAAKGLMDVYVAMKSPEKAEEVANEYSCANLSADEKENLYYNPALQSYVDSNYRDAIPKFNQYLTKFPAGRFSQDAHYYLANSFYKIHDTVPAIAHFETYLSGPTSVYFESASYRVSNYFYEKKEYENACKYYETLEQIAAKPSNILAAKIGLMRSNFLLKNYAKAKEYANKIKEEPGLTQPMRIEAEYAFGMSCVLSEDFISAIPSLEWLIKNTNSAKASEAKYYLAYIEYQNKNYDNSVSLIKELLKLKPSYNYWVAKGLILQTRIMVVKQEYLEAEQTIQSVIDFYPSKETDGILEEANELNSEIQQLQNPEKSIEEEPKKIIEIKPD